MHGVLWTWPLDIRRMRARVKRDRPVASSQSLTGFSPTTRRGEISAAVVRTHRRDRGDQSMSRLLRSSPAHETEWVAGRRGVGLRTCRRRGGLEPYAVSRDAPAGSDGVAPPNTPRAVATPLAAPDAAVARTRNGLRHRDRRHRWRIHRQAVRRTPKACCRFTVSWSPARTRVTVRRPTTCTGSTRPVPIPGTREIESRLAPSRTPMTGARRSTHADCCVPKRLVRRSFRGSWPRRTPQCGSGWLQISATHWRRR